MDPQGCCWWGRIAPMTRMDKGGDFAVRALLHPLQGHWLCAQEGATGQWCAWFLSEFGQNLATNKDRFMGHFAHRIAMSKTSMVLKFKCFVDAAWPQGDWLRGQVCEVQIQAGGVDDLWKSRMTLYIMICRETVYTTGASEIATSSFNGFFLCSNACFLLFFMQTVFAASPCRLVWMWP